MLAAGKHGTKHGRIPEVNSNDSIPILLGHSRKGLVLQDTSIGDQDMNTTEGIQCSLDESVTIFG